MRPHALHRLRRFMPVALGASAVVGACNALNGSDVQFGSVDGDGGTIPGRSDGSTTSDGGSSPDGQPPTDGAALDAPPPSCDPTKPFGVPTPLTTVNSVDDDEGARLSPDELTMYLSRDRIGANASGLFVATRTSTALPFGTPVSLPALGPAADLRFPSVRGDGLVLYAKATNGGGAGAGDVFFATRTAATLPFGTLSPLPVINGASDDGNPFIREDGLVLYFGTTRTGATDIYRADIKGNNQPSAPQAVTEIDSPTDNDTSPVVTPDDLTIYFASGRNLLGANRDIWVARRTNAQLPFGTPAVVPELTSAMDDVPTWVSRDQCRLYFASNRSGNYDIFLAKRP